MIARIWQAKTRPGMGDSYQSYLEKTGLKDYRATPGLSSCWCCAANLEI